MTTKSQILKSIRAKCLDCCVQQPNEVRLCAATTCDLWPYRFGKDPTPSKRGFAKNHSASREVLSGKTVPASHQSSEKDNPPKAGTSDGSKSKTLTGDLEVVDDEEDS